jgi:hypothetical protein
MAEPSTRRNVAGYRRWLLGLNCRRRSSMRGLFALRCLHGENVAALAVDLFLWTASLHAALRRIAANDRRWSLGRKPHRRSPSEDSKPYLRGEFLVCLQRTLGF